MTRRNLFLTTMATALMGIFGIPTSEAKPDAYSVHPDGSVLARVGDRWFMTGEKV